ncbi:ATP-binding protein [Janthinobacterium sp. SUN026]|uniref:AlbA family DNA-binding domain-containing protein n=1 Tax=Janthinobacterium sp. SUN026 TaxID=3002438 RepID=UPI0025B0F699|nr:ATP-binding protein [Janthinobacterium sp. SUN026]MDN2669780.1 ATP-binding protein [Janthinobacterium sp. SUN026]
MLKIDINSIDENYLRQLCEDACPESETLDFKRQLPSKADHDKTEISKDICALANSEGGVIIYGIDEKDGVASLICPITSETADSALRRIAQTTDSGIEPRVPSVRTRAIDVEGGYVVVIRVEASYDGPHCVRSNSNRRFVMRNGTTTTDMIYDQIRTGFTRTTALISKARRFASLRNIEIKEGRAALPLTDGALLVVHFTSLVTLAERAKVDMASLYSTGYQELIDPNDGGGTRSLNLDGLVIHDWSGSSHGYRFVFRDGSMEAVFLAGQVTEYGGQQPQRILWGKEITQDLRTVTRQFLKVAKLLEMNGAAILQCSIVNATNYKLGTGNTWAEVSKPGDRGFYELPPEWIDSIENAEVDKVIAPVLHTLWQSFGRSTCPHFDGNGDYIFK